MASLKLAPYVVRKENGLRCREGVERRQRNAVEQYRAYHALMLKRHGDDVVCRDSRWRMEAASQSNSSAKVGPQMRKPLPRLVDPCRLTLWLCECVE